MSNPFFEDWTAPFGAPPLDRIKAEHFRPAYDRALIEHTTEIAAIASNRAPPDFDNVVVEGGNVPLDVLAKNVDE